MESRDHRKHECGKVPVAHADRIRGFERAADFYSAKRFRVGQHIIIMNSFMIERCVECSCDGPGDTSCGGVTSRQRSLLEWLRGKEDCSTAT